MNVHCEWRLFFMAKSPTKGPNTTLAIAAIVFIMLGLGWTLYTANPGGMLRSKTSDEVKEEKEAKAMAEYKAKEDEMQRKKEAARANFKPK
jgi:hypothetical protein